jgi:GDP-4-dehydro-6-deoxy-D-mannose reductase
MDRVTSGGYRLDPGAVLVTGAAGFAARHLMEALGMGPGDFAADVTADFDAPEGVRRIAWELPGQPPHGLGPVRYVFHLAAISSISRSFEDPAVVYSVNASGTASVLEYVRRSCPGARLVLASSAEVYGASADPLSESCPARPVTPYGGSKLAAEVAALQSRRASGADVVIARCFPHFGPWQSPGFALPSFCRRVLEAVHESGRAIRVGNLSAVRDYLYVDDVVRAYLCLASSGEAGGIYNVCSGTGASMQELLMKIIDLAGSRLAVEPDPELFRPVDIPVQIGDPTRLESLGWSRGTGIEDGLRRLYDWWRDRT